MMFHGGSVLLSVCGVYLCFYFAVFPPVFLPVFLPRDVAVFICLRVVLYPGGVLGHGSTGVCGQSSRSACNRSTRVTTRTSGMRAHVETGRGERGGCEAMSARRRKGERRERTGRREKRGRL